MEYDTRRWNVRSIIAMILVSPLAVIIGILAGAYAIARWRVLNNVIRAVRRGRYKTH